MVVNDGEVRTGGRLGTRRVRDGTQEVRQETLGRVVSRRWRLFTVQL